jgi:two-component system chemotaxis response regulator CheY
MRKLIIAYLKRHDFEIADEAGNGEEAVAKYAECHPDIVTLDITMPYMDGLEALKQIKKLDKDAKVVMMSSMGQNLWLWRLSKAVQSTLS